MQINQFNNYKELRMIIIFSIKFSQAKKSDFSITILKNGGIVYFLNGEVHSDDHHHADHGFHHTHRRGIWKLEHSQAEFIDVHVQHLHGFPVGAVGEDEELFQVGGQNITAVQDDEHAERRYQIGGRDVDDLLEAVRAVEFGGFVLLQRDAADGG